MPDQATPQNPNLPPELPLDGIALPPTPGIDSFRSAENDREGASDPAQGTIPTPDDADPSLGDTVGTGTVIALACIAATIFLIVLGLIYVLIARLLG